MPPRTNVNPLTAFADKERTTPRLSLVNVPALNYLLRFEIFVSEDGQLRSAPLILDFVPLTRSLVDAGQAIRAGSPRLARIDVSILGFLASEDLPPAQLPAQRALPAAVVPEEEAGSSHSSLEEQIDQFQFAEEGEVSVRVVELSDSDTDLDRASATPDPGLVIVQVDTSQDIEEEGMDLKPRSGLRGLLSNRNKGQSSKDISKEQTATKAPAPPLPPTSDAALQSMPNLRRKRLVEEPEEGEVGREKARPQKKGKEVKDPRDKRTRSVDSRDEAAIWREQRTWSPRLELDGAPISWDATLWESQRGQASFLAEALQQPLLLPQDMEGLRNTRQPDLFMSLKRGMPMVNGIFYLVLILCIP